MTEEQKKELEQIQKDIGAANVETREIVRNVIMDSRETVRNLSLVSGALATGSLVMLGSDLPTEPILVMIGIIALLAQVLLIFGYLLHRQKLDIEEIGGSRLFAVIRPIKRLMMKADLIEGKMTQQDFDKEMESMSVKDTEHMKELSRGVLVAEKSRTSNDLDLLFFTLLAIGCVFIGLGIAAPHFEKTPNSPAPSGLSNDILYVLCTYDPTDSQLKT